jgi:hypothetical protein
MTLMSRLLLARISDQQASLSARPRKRIILAFVPANEGMRRR